MSEKRVAPAQWREANTFFYCDMDGNVAMRAWLASKGLSYHTFYPSFLRECLRIMKLFDNGTITERERDIVRYMREWPTSVPHLQMAMDWFGKEKWNHDNGPLTWKESNEIKAMEERLFFHTWVDEEKERLDNSDHLKALPERKPPAFSNSARKRLANERKHGVTIMDETGKFLAPAPSSVSQAIPSVVALVAPASIQLASHIQGMSMAGVFANLPVPNSPAPVQANPVPAAPAAPFNLAFRTKYVGDNGKDDDDDDDDEDDDDGDDIIE